jgi:hypothetical protein
MRAQVHSPGTPNGMSVSHRNATEIAERATTEIIPRVEYMILEIPLAISDAGCDKH